MKIPTFEAAKWSGLVSAGRYSDGIGGININNGNERVHNVVTNALETIRNPNASEEDKDKARSNVEVGFKTQTEKLYNKMSKYATAAEAMSKVQEQDRMKTFIGYLDQYMGVTDYARQYGELSAAESMALTTLATAALSGTLSNQDMDKVQKQVTNLKKSGAFNAGVMVNALDKMIYDIEYSTQGIGGIDILRPQARKQYDSMVLLRNMLAQKN